MSGNDTNSSRGEPMATLTHARLRVAQGDIRGARALLRQILERDGDAPEAEELLRRIAGGADRIEPPERERPLEPPEPGDPAKLSEDFRRFFTESGTGRRATIERLEEWLGRICGRLNEPR